jgi:serine/threonine protein kinase
MSTCSTKNEGRARKTKPSQAPNNQETVYNKQMRRNAGILALDLDLVNQTETLSYKLDESAFCQDGITVGPDFLRLEGVTISRGVLLPRSIELQDIIGKGAFSTVRRARWKHSLLSSSGSAQQQHDDGHDQCYSTVAIKNCNLLDASPERRKMLLRELRALCLLDCCNLVCFHGAFLQPDIEEVALVLEYMDMGSLRQHIPREQANEDESSQSRGGFCESILASIMFQMISGLIYLHERKILHRDLKTDNVLLASEGFVKLCDFGVSTILDDSIAMGQTLIGTAMFMSPERLRAQPHGSQSDIWSFGLVCLECLTGQVQWSQDGAAASIVELLMTIEETDTEALVPATIAEKLRELLIGCLQVHPGKKEKTLRRHCVGRIHLITHQQRNVCPHEYCCNPRGLWMSVSFARTMRLAD